MRRTDVAQPVEGTFLDKLRMMSTEDLESAAWRFAPIGVLSHVERDTLTTGTTANLTAQPVPWGSRERAGEVTKLMADHRAEGAGNCFYSIAPDDVHNALSIRDDIAKYAHVTLETKAECVRAYTKLMADHRAEGAGNCFY